MKGFYKLEKNAKNSKIFMPTENTKMKKFSGFYRQTTKNLFFNLKYYVSCIFSLPTQKKNNFTKHKNLSVNVLICRPPLAQTGSTSHCEQQRLHSSHVGHKTGSSADFRRDVRVDESGRFLYFFEKNTLCPVCALETDS